MMKDIDLDTVIDADYVVVDPNYISRKAMIVKLIPVILAVVTAMLICTTLTSCSNGNRELIEAPDFTGCVLDLSVYTNELKLYPSHITVNLGNKSYEFNIDLSDSELNHYNCDNNHVNIEYDSLDTEGNKLGITTKLIISENSNLDSLRDSDSTTYKKLKNNGVLSIEQVKESDNIEYFHNDMANIIYDMGYYENSNKDDVVLNMEGLGVFSMKSILGTEVTIGVEYDNDGKVLIKDTQDTNNSILISKGNDSDFDNNSDEETEAFKIIEKEGQLTVKTPKGCYLFEYGNNTDIKDNILKQIIPETTSEN